MKIVNIKKRNGLSPIFEVHENGKLIDYSISLSKLKKKHPDVKIGKINL